MNQEVKGNLNKIMDYAAKLKIETLAFATYTTYFSKKRYLTGDLQAMFDYLSETFKKSIDTLYRNDFVFDFFVFDYDNHMLYAQMSNDKDVKLTKLWGE